jgi:hypothetical protein
MLLSTHTIAQMLKARCRFSVPAMSLAQTVYIARPAAHIFVTGFLCLGITPAAAAPKAAVFDFELQYSDSALSSPDKKEAEGKRLKMISDRLREQLAASGTFEIVDIAPVAAQAAAANLQACGNCADDMATKIGARYAVTGVVFKVSELILSMNVFVREAETDKPVTSGIVDMRGNTDESWSRGVDYLYKRLLAPRLKKQLP